MIFETSIIIALLIAVYKSKQPYQFAIILVVLTAVLARPIEMYGLYWAESLVAVIPGLYLGEPVWIPFDLIIIMQTFFAGFLVFASLGVKGTKERRFFHIMAGFMLFNCALIPAYRLYIIPTPEAYTALYHAASILQVLTVFLYQNGFTKLIGSIRHSIFQHNSGTISIRS